MHPNARTIVFVAVTSVVGVAALAQPSQSTSTPNAKGSGSKTAAQLTQDRILHDGLNPSTVNRAEKRKLEVPAAMRSVPAEIKDESNCRRKSGDA